MKNFVPFSTKISIATKSAVFIICELYEDAQIRENFSEVLEAYQVLKIRLIVLVEIRINFVVWDLGDRTRQSIVIDYNVMSHFASNNFWICLI